MTDIDTIEQAYENQSRIHALIDSGEHSYRWDEWRWESLHPDYEMRCVPGYGLGVYPVHRETGEVCEWKGQWDGGGSVLLCTTCFIDGT